MEGDEIARPAQGRNVASEAWLGVSNAREASVLRWLVGVLVLAALAVLVPFWAPLLLAAWVALIAWPLQQRLSMGLHHRNVAAASIAVLLALAVLVPFALVVASLSGAALSLAARLADSKTATAALKALSGGSSSSGLDLPAFNVQYALELARRYGANAFGAARSLFGAATLAVVSAAVFCGSFFVFLVDGKRLAAWLLERSPLSRGDHHRLVNVFAEVGRGLLIGVGLTALAQGFVATVGYVVTGVPQALVLGLVTVFASLIPSVGSGLVWVPVTAGLWVSGRTTAAITMLVIGLVVSVTDNIIRPLLSRYAALRMHGLLIFVSMLGGLVLFGGWGLLLGPLFVRYAMEGLDMLRDIREHESPVSEP
ncbi:MAG TPA: AI-2E family transporter [Polyangiaceae bacterium]